MGENNERINRLRQSEDFQKTKAIFAKILHDVDAEQARKTGAFRWSFPAEKFELNCVEFYEKWQESEKVSGILRNLKTQVAYPDAVYSSMNKLLVYVGLVESLGATLVDMTLMLFIAAGKEIHTKGAYTKHVTSFKELAHIELGYKLDLIKTEGLEIFNKFINRELRNIVAHLRFRIQENGEIRRNNDNNPIHIDDEISKFWDGVDMLKLILEDLRFLETCRNHYELFQNPPRITF